MARLPRLRMNQQMTSYSYFMTQLSQLGQKVDIYYRGKGNIADELACLRNHNGKLVSWNIALNHPLELDHPNMIFVSVSFGSSALLEGISRGIPGMIVRDFHVEDYTLLDPQYIPTGKSDVIIEEIKRCMDYGYRKKMIDRQLMYYCEETGHVIDSASSQPTN